MGTDRVCRYNKSDRTKLTTLFLALSVFLPILFCSSLAFAVVDVTLAWDPPDKTEDEK